MMMFQVTSNFLWMVYKISLVMIMVRSANIYVHIVVLFSRRCK